MITNIVNINMSMIMSIQVVPILTQAIIIQVVKDVQDLDGMMMMTIDIIKEIDIENTNLVINYILLLYFIIPILYLNIYEIFYVIIVF